MAIPCNAQLTINIRYTAPKGAAKQYVKEMEESGIAARIRAVEGCLRYDYFFPADDPEGLLLIDEWADQAALDRYHASPMMQEAAALREKYQLGGRQIRRYQAITESQPRAVLSSKSGNENNMNQALSPRRQGLAMIAAMEAKGDQAGLEKAAAEALDNGLTISEAKEALSQLYAYTGFPRSLNALGTLQKLLQQRQAAGISDNPGKDADPLPADYDALKQGTAVQTKLSGQPFNYSFVPATDYYLKAHLFGDIFDPSFTGESGGEPRRMASPDINTEDFLAAVDFLSTNELVDPERIGIIGICGWGGMAINAAALDPRIKATVTSTMYDMSRVAREGYFGSTDSEAARNAQRQAWASQRTEDYRTGTYKRAGGVVDPLPDDA